MADYKSETKSIIGSFVFVVCFIIACLFIYWAIEYWVDRNFDKGRYEIVKIQPAPGVDSLSFWKLDRRTGVVEYCSLEMTDKKDNETRGKEFICIRATVINPPEKEEDPKHPRPQLPTDMKEEKANAQPSDPVVTVTGPAVTTSPTAAEMVKGVEANQVIVPASKAPAKEPAKADAAKKPAEEPKKK